MTTSAAAAAATRFFGSATTFGCGWLSFRTGGTTGLAFCRWFSSFSTTAHIVVARPAATWSTIITSQIITGRVSEVIAILQIWCKTHLTSYWHLSGNPKLPILIDKLL